MMLFLKRTLENLGDILKNKYKVKINGGKKKTEVVVCSKDPENNIKMDDDALKQVPKFKYLGSILVQPN